MTAPTDALIDRLEKIADDMDEIAQAIVDTATKAGAAGRFANRSVRNEDSAAVREAAALVKSLLARIEAAEKVIQPFAEAAAHIPRDREDQIIVALVPGGHNSEAFQAMRKPLTAGNLRAAAQWLQGQEGEG